MSGRLRLSGVCPLLLLATLGGCAWPGGGSETETVTLRFDWPVGLTAFVQTERSTRTSGPRGPSTATVRMSYRIDVEEAPDGRLMRYGDIRAEDPGSGRSYPLDELPERVASQFIAVLPSYVVNDEGRVVRLDEIELLIEEARRRLQRGLAGLPPGSAEARALAVATVSEEGFLAAVREHWEQLAGGWSGTSLVLGETYRREGRMAVPPLGGVQVASTVEFGAIQRVPCSEEMAAADCVEIEVRSYPAPEALARLEEAIHGGSLAAPATALGALENLEIEETSYLVTEPSTLIPHYLETTRKFQATLPRPDEPDAPILKLDQIIYRYGYPPQ